MLLFATASSATAPGFDCRKATTPQEKEICGDEELSKLDAEMSRAYRGLLSSLESPEAAWLKAAQKEWLHARNLECTSGAGIAACLHEQLKQRLDYLKLRELAAAAPSAARTLSGVYIGPEKYRVATLELRPTAAGRAWGRIESASARSVCSFIGSGSLDNGKALLVDPETPACLVEVRISAGTATVSADPSSCASFCGANGSLSGTYVKQ